MKNINGKLEISQWLFSKGFKPDCVITFSKEPKEEFYELSKNNDPSFLIEYTRVHGFDKISPFFTTDRCLELLPEKLDPKQTFGYSLGINKRGLGYIHDKDSKHGIDVLFWESIIDNDTNLAALRLLKKVVEAGYLKGEIYE